MDKAMGEGGGGRGEEGGGPDHSKTASDGPESGNLTMFPMAKDRMPREVVRRVDTIIYCSCRMLKVPPMVECSKCKEWYHVKCVSVPKRALENQNIDWYFTNCSIIIAIFVYLYS